jgi:hypothetical protein
MIVGLSVTRGIRLETASTSTVFLPPTFAKLHDVNLSNTKQIQIAKKTQKWRVLNLDINLQSKICKNLFVHFEHLLCTTAL